jgi:hypothetical protein
LRIQNESLAIATSGGSVEGGGRDSIRDLSRDVLMTSSRIARARGALLGVDRRRAQVSRKPRADAHFFDVLATIRLRGIAPGWWTMRAGR